MDLRFSAEDEAFRAEVRDFLETALAAGGDFAAVRGRGGPGDEHSLFEERLAWERHLGANGWTCVAWPKEHGGRGLSLHQQVIYYEEYARARAPGAGRPHRRDAARARRSSPSARPSSSSGSCRRSSPATTLWCQGYSEPEAGSDLANIKTRAVLGDGGDWSIAGQKVWTSLAQLGRSGASSWPAPTRDAAKHKGISLPARADGPARHRDPAHRPGHRRHASSTRCSSSTAPEADGRPRRRRGRTAAGGWRWARSAFERGASTLGQNLNFVNEFDDILEPARANGQVKRSRPCASGRRRSGPGCS